MSIFGSIMSAIIGVAKSAGSAISGSATAAPGAPSGTAPMAQVDVEATLTKLAAENKEKLDWRKSIVDLMKLLGMDSSLENRKELATELGYQGEKDGSAEMNIWLHKEVMRQLAAHGGKVPANLTD